MGWRRCLCLTQCCFRAFLGDFGGGGAVGPDAVTVAWGVGGDAGAAGEAAQAHGGVVEVIVGLPVSFIFNLSPFLSIFGNHFPNKTCARASGSASYNGARSASNSGPRINGQRGAWA